MSIRNAFAGLALLATLPFLTACGGGEAPKQESAPATSAAAPDASAPAAGGTGSITGKISFEGTVPPADKVKVSADPKCQSLHPNGLEKQPIKVKDGGLADVLVYVKSGVSGTFPAPSTPVLLDQNGCTYHPHVVAMQTGQPLTIRNSDDTLHNIHPRPTVNQEFNEAEARKGMEKTKTFDKAEPWIVVGCDVHPWMRAYIAVVPHPFFAVSAEDGSFTIKGLPDGDYEIETIHEKLKTQTQKVSIKGGQAATLDVTYKG